MSLSRAKPSRSTPRSTRTAAMVSLLRGPQPLPGDFPAALAARAPAAEGSASQRGPSREMVRWRLLSPLTGAQMLQTCCDARQRASPLPSAPRSPRPLGLSTVLICDSCCVQTRQEPADAATAQDPPTHAHSAWLCADVHLRSMFRHSVCTR